MRRRLPLARRDLTDRYLADPFDFGTLGAAHVLGPSPG